MVYVHISSWTATPKFLASVDHHGWRWDSAWRSSGGQGVAVGLSADSSSHGSGSSSHGSGSSSHGSGSSSHGSGSSSRYKIGNVTWGHMMEFFKGGEVEGQKGEAQSLR